MGQCGRCRAGNTIPGGPGRAGTPAQPDRGWERPVGLEQHDAVADRVLAAKLKELAYLRVSILNGCGY